MSLTPKQELFCQKYVLTGNKSEAYRIAYNADNMKDETIHKKASALTSKEEVRGRIQEIQKDLEDRNKLNLDKVIQHISEIATFDIAECYNESGRLKSIHDIPKNIRSAITGIKVYEENTFIDGNKIKIGETKELKIINKLDALKDLMKHFGGYENDNKQKAGLDLTKLDDETLKKVMSCIAK